jgi:tetratricopeptide (TPR) repeat protein
MQHLRLVDEPGAPATVRERELEVGRLVLSAAEGGDPFVLRRAAAAVAELESSPARRALRRAVEAVDGGDERSLQASLVTYGATLERHGVHDGAGEVYGVVMRLWPGAATATLHAARAARRSGRRDDALRLYRQAGRECGGDAHMTLLVRIGEALVSDDGAAALTAVVRDARRRGDRDALAVAREERSRYMLAARRTGAALRDLAAAAVRYTDTMDRLRVLHRMAEILAARGDLLAAREVLLAALEQASAGQRGHSVQRLRAVARALGDELELRRTRGRATSSLITLAPRRSNRPAAARSAAPRLQRWRAILPPPACRT